MSARRGLASALLFAAALAAGCGAEPHAPPSPQRILALAPTAAEICYELGLGDRVVGVGDYVRWPPAWDGKPRLGGLFNPQLERIAALRPDLAILLPSEAPLAEKLAALEVPTLTIPSETLGDVEEAIRLIAKGTGVPEAGLALVNRWRGGLLPHPLPRPLRVALVVGREPGRLGEIVVAGRETFFAQLARRLGTVNVFEDAPTRYPQVSAEDIVLRRPDAIVELQPLEVPETRVAALQRDWLALAPVPAVAHGCLPVVDGEHVLIPGPRLPLLYDQLRVALESCVAVPDDTPDPPSE
ncbi:MAG: helical backbone metal receptor [Thermoanaerobaculia bacterium]